MMESDLRMKLQAIRIGDEISFTWNGVKAIGTCVGFRTTITNDGPYILIDSESKDKQDKQVHLNDVISRQRQGQTVVFERPEQ